MSDGAQNSVDNEQEFTIKEVDLKFSYIKTERREEEI